MLHWLCEAPSPYNADLFRALAGAPGIDLTVHYRRPALGSHPWRSDLLAGYGSRQWQCVLGIDWPLIGLALDPRGRRNRVFIVAGWHTPTSALLMLALITTGGRYFVWTDTPDATHRRPPIRGALRAAWLRLAFRKAERILGTGAPALVALRQMGAPAERLVNFPYWLDLGRFPHQRRARRPDAPLNFMSVGRIELARKGQDIALRALAAHASTPGWCYRVAGDGPDAAALKSLAVELGIGDRVEVLGWLEPDAVAAEIRAADVLIHPSPAHEPYGVAVLEAMAAGLAVLASDRTCAALDRVRHGESGFIHPAGDVEALAGDIGRLLADPDLRMRMGAAARDLAGRWPIARGVETILAASRVPAIPTGRPIRRNA